MDMELRAKKFAMRAHGAIDQRRKYTNEPYIAHPAAVVELVRGVPHTPEMLCAAWLHDTVEDTPVALGEIEYEFGIEVGALVEMLTDVSKPSDGNRSVRKAIDREHTAKANPQAKTIKLADLIVNTRDIVERDPVFAKVYIPEKVLLLEVLRGGDEALWNIAHDMVIKYLAATQVKNAVVSGEGREQVWQQDWFDDTVAEYQMMGMPEKEAKEQAMSDWYTYKVPNVQPDSSAS